jgi:hypothetical protein
MGAFYDAKNAPGCSKQGLPGYNKAEKGFCAACISCQKKHDF